MNITKPFDNKSSKAKSRTKSLDPESYQQNFDCNQGFLNLENCSSKDSGLVVLKGSHKYHTQIFEMFEKEMNKTDEYYYELNKKVIAWLLQKEVLFYGIQEHFIVIVDRLNFPNRINSVMYNIYVWFQRPGLVKKN